MSYRFYANRQLYVCCLGATVCRNVIALQFKIGLDPIMELLLKWSVGVVGSRTGSKWWEHTRLTLTAAAITPRMKRAQRDCCYGTMTPISFPHHKKYCAFPIRSLDWFLGTMYVLVTMHLLSSFFYWKNQKIHIFFCVCSFWYVCLQ